MVKTEFGLLEVQRKGLRWDAFELSQTQFGIGPEGLDSVYMAVTSSKHVFTMMDSKVLGVSDVPQALIASPTVTVDDAIDRDMTSNNLLQRGLSGIRDNLRIDPAIALEDTEDNGFRSGNVRAYPELAEDRNRIRPLHKGLWSAHSSTSLVRIRW